MKQIIIRKMSRKTGIPPERIKRACDLSRKEIQKLDEANTPQWKAMRKLHKFHH